MDTIDRISNLPDDILCHILSFLPTKYSVRTRILSTRWKYLFSLVPVLHFSNPGSSDTQTAIHPFHEFVNFVFNSYNVNHMNKIFYNSPLFLPETESIQLLFWILYSVVRHGVQELDVTGFLYKPLKLPILTSETLTTLKLYLNFSLVVPEIVWLPRLKTLDLLGVTFIGDDSIRRLFRSCPVLEFLFLNNCQTNNIQVIDICVPSLIILKIHGTEEEYELVLDVPNVKYFEYHGTRSGGFTTRDGFKSLVNACIKCSYMYEEFRSIPQLIGIVSHVQGLQCDGFILEAFRLYDGMLPIFHSLTRLELDIIAIFDFELKLLVDLLDKTPHLDVLVLNNELYYEEHDLGDYALEHVPTCVSTHLKVIEFRGFSMLLYEYYLVKYFLKNAKVLNQVYIQSKQSLKKKYQINKTLLTLSRCSRACQIFIDSVDERGR